uniref:Uncharacterized protein n=1 Tax=Podoviridae sp. ctzeq1 TaxID=2826597 RepID=A0A8S5M0T6_9CAUD|nr:MAG TPA: protein of unknown function (DUF5392) [Podoviridae sp. ctzeq1]
MGVLFMSSDFKEALPWFLFIALLFAIAYGMNKSDESKSKDDFRREVEYCMEKMHKSYAECKEITYEAE